MNSKEVKRLTLALTEPYKIPDDCPYLSEEQKALSLLPFKKRVEWMAEWLMLAEGVELPEDTI